MKRRGESKVAQTMKFIPDFIRKNGRGPTYTEIQNATHVGDTTAIFRKLAATGVITYKAGDYRSARLVERPGLSKVRESTVQVTLSRGVLEETKAVLEAQRERIDAELRAVREALSAAG